MRYTGLKCRECGGSFEAERPGALFDSVICKQRYNNRRRNRGAELYDFIMNEGPASDMVKRLVAAYKSADLAKREGRPSYLDIQAARLNIPHAFGKAGDGR